MPATRVLRQSFPRRLLQRLILTTTMMCFLIRILTTVVMWVYILITGHEVPDLLDVSDYVIWMAAGTTHGLGSPGQARAHDQFKREYLGNTGG